MIKLLVQVLCLFKGVDTGGGGGGGGGGGALGAEGPPLPRFSALHYILLGTVIDLLALISLKPPKL